MDLFSGIGGMTLALKDISTPLLYCDNCPHAQGVLKKNMQLQNICTAPIIQDVKHISGKTPSIDIITAGFPCTGFSVSGNMHGFCNEESALFFEVVRICKITAPVIVFLENTPWVRSREALIRKCFTEQGYSMHCVVLPAYAAGYPQSRKRWWGLAYKSNKLLLRNLHEMSSRPLGALASPCRSCATENVDMAQRFALLRNAVVPGCARLALHILSGLALGKNMHTQFDKPNLGLVLKSKDKLILKIMWPTLHGHYQRKAVSLTDRASRNIVTAVMYEQDTSHGYINVHFLEWLMGFPTDWTDYKSYRLAASIPRDVM